MTTLKSLWIVILLATLAGGCQRRDAPPDAAVAAQEIFIDLAESDLAAARAGEIARTLSANGTLRAMQQSSVRAKVAGEITAVNAREGERVRAGQVLAQIDRSDFLSRLAERQSGLEAARAQAAFAESTRRKNEELLQKKFISQQAYDSAKSNAESNAALAQAQDAQLALARKALEDTVVRAPIDGWIAERAVQVGDKTAIDGKLFTVVDLSRLEFEALVPAHEIAQVALGQSFVTTLPGYGEKRFVGRVARIGPSSQGGNRYVPIYIEIDNPGATLKTGLFAEGRLTLDRREATVLIPSAALRSESGVNFVYAIAAGRVKRQAVEIGLTSESAGTIEITKGLTAGTQVLAANLGPLKEGARIRIASKKAAP
ncbi:MAG: efflux RND transporter periplasmic adaptor subunit [Proteobacteria bacterium]|nr:efflux RND transporter periplasmic adaptor subunit [Pseudomonadota bacterium]